MGGPFVLARDNPFRVDRVLQLRYRLKETDWDGLLARLEAMEYRGAIVGPHGSGKTTLLEEIGEQLITRGFEPVWIRLNTTNRAISRDILVQVSRARHQIILLDGCEQLSTIGWWRFRWVVRRAQGLVVTTHSPGRLPTLFECRTSPALLTGLLTELRGGELDLSPSEIEALYHKHRGNIRDVLRELYDCMAGKDADERKATGDLQCSL